jgi:hypothetical protein
MNKGNSLLILISFKCDTCYRRERDELEELRDELEELRELLERDPLDLLLELGE